MQDKNKEYADIVSIIIPCFNEEDCIEEMFARVIAVFEGIPLETYEVVLVDDRSTDSTWNKIAELGNQNPQVTAIRLTRNHGHQLAVTAGLMTCIGYRALVLDADLQDPPELLLPMMEIMDDGADVVYGQRRSRAGETWFKRKSAELYYKTLNVFSETPMPPNTGDFRLINRRTIELLRAMPERQRYVRGIISWLGLDQRPLLYDRAARFSGKTKYSMSRMFGLALNGITSFSIIPLRFASALGFAMFAISMMLMIHVFYSWYFLGAVSGWTSMMTVVLLVGGVQLLVLGIIGEYVGRIFIEVKQRPIFLVDQIIRDGKQVPPSSAAPEQARNFE